MSKEKLQVVVLAALILLGTVYAYVTFLLLPQMSVIQGKQQEIATKKEDVQRLLTYSANPQIFEREIQTQERELTKISEVIPIALNKPVLTYNIYTTIKRNNLLAESIVFDPPENKEFYQVMGMSFSVLGNSSDIMDCIYELHNSRDALVLRNVTFVAQEEGVKADLKFQAYARLGSIDRTDKPPFMNSTFGIDSITKLFRPQ